MKNLNVKIGAMLLLLALGLGRAFAQDAPAEPISPDKPIDLFNGKDLTGWTYDILEEGVEPGAIYKVEEGIIKNAGSPRAVMRTEQSYRDYEIEVQWRWPDKGGNSGLLIHCSKPRERNIWPKSLEVQLQSGDAGDFWIIGETIKVKDAESRTTDRRTINYTDSSEKPLGEWNTAIVQVRGNTLKVYINGELVNEAWDCSASSGAICLQAEGTPVEYRKVQIRPLPELKAE